MSRTKYLKGQCGYCGGKLEFPADAIGTTVDCPHCAKPTELTLAPLPPEQSAIPRKGLIYAVVAGIILALGLLGALAALKRAERMARKDPVNRSTNSATQKQPTADPATQAASTAGFEISPITLEKTPGSSLVYAVGNLHNTAAKQRFGVRIELDVLDANGTRLSTAKDYQQVIEPNGQWQFHALVTDSKASSAKLASVKEDVGAQ